MVSLLQCLEDRVQQGKPVRAATGADIMGDDLRCDAGFGRHKLRRLLVVIGGTQNSRTGAIKSRLKSRLKVEG